jgi:hypothetical protein
MSTPNVCTAPATHGRIVSTTFASRGATTCQAKNQLIDSQLAEGSKTQIRNPKSEIRNLLEVLDLTLINLIYSLTSHLGLVLSLVLFAFLAVNHPFKSAFRNLLGAHERPVYRRLSRIIGFEISPKSDRGGPFASPWGRGKGEGVSFPCSIEPLVSIKNHCGRLQRLKNHSWSPCIGVYLRLSALKFRPTPTELTVFPFVWADGALTAFSISKKTRI